MHDDFVSLFITGKLDDCIRAWAHIQSFNPGRRITVITLITLCFIRINRLLFHIKRITE